MLSWFVRGRLWGGVLLGLDKLLLLLGERPVLHCAAEETSGKASGKGVKIEINFSITERVETGQRRVETNDETNDETK